MKIQIKNYSFNPTGKTITFNDYLTIRQDSILLITNVTVGTIIYNFANPEQIGIVNGNILTLNYNTTLMNSNDSLQIFYEDETIPSTEATAQLLLTLSENINDSVFLLKRIAKIVEPISTQDWAQRQRVAIDSGTLSTLTNISQISGVDYRWQIMDQARATYANSIRNNITF